MPDINLDITTKNYKLADNRLLCAWDIKSPEDNKFYYQLRFLKSDTQKIDFNLIENKLRNCITKLNHSQKLLFNEKLEFLKFFSNLGFDKETTAILEKKEVNKKITSQILFKLDNTKKNIIQLFEKKLLDLVVLETIKNGDKTYLLSYQTPKDIKGDNVPLCNISIYIDEELTEKIYLFPIKSLDNVWNTLKSDSINPDNLNLNIPYVRDINPLNKNKLNHNDIKTRINLQTLIAEILIHLEKPKFFRKNSFDKIAIFQELSEKISLNCPLSDIKTILDSHNRVKVLSKHRDLWGFFAFVKGETYSAYIWKELEKMLQNQEQSAGTSFSHRS